ncbi:MarC family protein [Wielerella bovis]|uniref:MarC family protein n=1 Tax=Wielerella bovis TaxID=2917790 RepID=UPI0020193811|nr:MarC family protein [Wielerella bovis]MCG7657467.1 MarC family protein [Wielerella bovis]MCG7659688.1 MarC family protein [Wielerella bovis]ULJ63638.1 MarC family protein [Wielerella bovis]
MKMNFELGKLFLALVVLINPLGALAIYLELTQNFTKRERRQVARLAAFSVLILAVVFTLTGSLLLKILGIRIGSFQIGGGILLFLISVSMVRGGSNPAKPDIGTSENNEIQIKTPQKADLASIAVVPIAMPMMIGPGGISAVIIQSTAAQTIQDTLLLLGADVLVAALCYLGLITADKISKWLGQTGLTIFNRIMGMMLAAVSIEIILAGARSLLPQWFS